MTRRADLLAEARTWLGTPYAHQAARKGAGCDCLGLVRALLAFATSARLLPVPPYAPGWAVPGGDDLLAGADLHLVAIPVLHAAPGDVLAFRLRGDLPVKHLAVVSAPDRMIHAYDRAGVRETAIGPFWRRRIAAAFAFPGVTP